MSDIEQAERVARARATLFYMMAAVLVLSALLGVGHAPDRLRIGIWIVMAALIALNLTPFGGWLRPQRVNALLNDESTQAHRQTSFAAGFWAAIVSALAVGLVGGALTPFDVARVVVTAALAAALASFATLELRAAG